jgi:hypothetical protein
MEAARYLYSVASTARAENLGDIGIEEKPVYTVPYRDIAAVIHSCEPRPYETNDEKLAREWVLEHAYVIDQATTRFGTVLPVSFDVIIRGDDLAVKDWLSRNYVKLRQELERVKGKSEYSVQIFYDYDKMASRVLRDNPDLEGLKRRLAKEPKGKAYLLQRSLDMKLQDLVSSETSRLAERFCSEIKQLTEDLKVEDRRTWRVERFSDKRLLASYSCLVRRDNVESLGEALENIDRLEGLSVRFTGPWSPFSFVGLEA